MAHLALYPPWSYSACSASWVTWDLPASLPLPGLAYWGGLLALLDLALLGLLGSLLQHSGAYWVYGAYCLAWPLGGFLVALAPGPCTHSSITGLG